MRATRLREGGPLGRSPDGLVDGARDNPFAIWARGNTIDGKLVALELCLLRASISIPNPAIQGHPIMINTRRSISMQKSPTLPHGFSSYVKVFIPRMRVRRCREVEPLLGHPPDSLVHRARGTSLSIRAYGNAHDLPCVPLKLGSLHSCFNIPNSARKLYINGFCKTSTLLQFSLHFHMSSHVEV